MANHGIEGTAGIILIPAVNHSKKIPASNCTRIKRTIRSRGYFHFSAVNKLVLERIIFLVAKKPS